MRSTISLALGVVSIVFVLLFVPVWSQSGTHGEQREPHDFRSLGMDCRSCHMVVGLRAGGEMRRSVSEICSSCHKLAGSNHPVDVKPSFALPAGLPLDSKGLMTCATCHDPHRPYLNALTGEKTMYLRRDGPKKVFCMACHSGAVRTGSVL